MVSDDEVQQRTRGRAVSDNELFREFEYRPPPRTDNDDDHDDHDAQDGRSRSSRSGQGTGRAGTVGEAEVGSSGAKGVGVAAAAGKGRAPKQPSWGKRKKSGRGLFFRSGSSHPKTQDGLSPSSPGPVVGATTATGGSGGGGAKGMATNLPPAGVAKKSAFVRSESG